MEEAALTEAAEEMLAALWLARDERAEGSTPRDSLGSRSDQAVRELPEVGLAELHADQVSLTTTSQRPGTSVVRHQRPAERLRPRSLSFAREPPRSSWSWDKPRSPWTSKQHGAFRCDSLNPALRCRPCPLGVAGRSASDSEEAAPALIQGNGGPYSPSPVCWPFSSLAAVSGASALASTFTSTLSLAILPAASKALTSS